MSTPLARCRAHVLFQTVAEGGVLLDTETEVYFGLNAVGARVCNLLHEHNTLEGLCLTLGQDYPEVAQETLHQDVSELLAKLVDYGLLEQPGRQPAHSAGGQDTMERDHAGRSAP